VIRRFAAGGALVMLGALAGCSSSPTPVAVISGVSNSSGLTGDVLTPPTAEAPIDLPSDKGGRYDIRGHNAGGVTLVYFGYTHCPDICPTFMADTAEAIRQSSPAVQSKVSVVFISVDPKRDTMPVLRRWLAHFNPDFIGLRGSIRQVIKAQRELDVPVSKVNPHSKHGYSVTHSAELLAFTPDHLAHVLYTEGPDTIENLKHDLAILTTDKEYGA